MKLHAEPVTLVLRRPFHVAHGASDIRSNVLVRLESGLGEAAAVPYYGETQAGILEYLRGLDLAAVGDPFQIEEILGGLPAGSAAARAAIDIALHDHVGQLLGQPLYRLLGLNPARIPPSSITIAIDSPEAMAEQAAATGWPILKIKLGIAGDEARLRSIRGATDATLRADANGGWSRAEAAALLPLLAELGVELVEQPLPPGDLDGLRALFAMRTRPRIFVDEGVCSIADIVAHAGVVDGVVIKLAKAGGIREALRQITVARGLGLSVMLGCMIESSVAVTAAAHLAALAQYVDLDGPTLIQNDPVQGVRYDKGRLILPDRPGLGLEPS
jgi:L-alanine-DL-glutamate epimerase-like enolase superfamily enzyme